MAFATIEDIKKFLQVEITSDEAIASINRALDEATAAIKNYTNQVLELVQDETISLESPGGTRLTLPQLPVVDISAVEDNGTDLVSGDDYVLGAGGILYRIPVWTKWSYGPQAVTITYSHGYATIPDDIVSVATRMAARAYQSGLRSGADNAVLGVSSKSLGDFSVSYGGEQSGGVGEGLLGASAARIILLSEKDILNKYKVKRYYDGL
jgi:hypothetical protein